MSIEISPSKQKIKFRINPHVPTNVDFKLNKHGAQWEHFDHYALPHIAIENLLRLSREGKEGQGE